MKTTVLVADDHALLRQGLAMLIREQPDWEVVAEAANGAEAVRLAAKLQPTIALLDVEMPEMDGIDAARAIAKVSPATCVIALSTYSDLGYRERMWAAGARAYVLKNEAMDDLVAAVSVALLGERFLSPSITRGEQPAPQRSAEVDKSSLSQRELEVLRLLAEGKRGKDIAQTMGISTRTVDTYRSRLMLKLGIRSVAGLVKFALRAGLTSPQL